jgi:hypothetical protein
MIVGKIMESKIIVGNFLQPQPSALGMREEDCMNAARRVSEREGASQMARINTDGGIGLLATPGQGRLGRAYSQIA